MSEKAVAVPMRRVLSFAMITAGGFVLGKLSGIATQVVVSAHFGLSGEIDAYVLAGLVPATINNVIGGSAITAAVMPTFGRYLTAGNRKEFWYAASVITNIVLLITGAVTVLGMLLAFPIMSILASTRPVQTQSQAAFMLVIMMPTLFLGAGLNMLMAMLNSVDRFTGPALIFLALNIGMIITVIVLTPYIGVYAVAWGFLVGVILQVVIQIIELRLEHPQYCWKIDMHHPALREVMMAFVPITALAVTSQINPVVDPAMAATLPEGSTAALNYANVVLGAFYMIGYSLGIAVYPNLSRLAAVNDLENTGRMITTSLRLLIFILAPVTFLLMTFAVPTVGLLLGRGKFDAVAVQMTAQALAMYAVGLIAIAALQVIQRAYYALSDARTPFAIGVLAAVLHIGLNVVLMQYWAHAGIALSASITTVLSVAVLVYLFQRRVHTIDLKDLVNFVLRCGLLGLLSTAAVAWLFFKLDLGTGTIAYVVGVALAATGGGLYLVLASATRTPESAMVWRTGLSLLKKYKVWPAQ